MNKKSILYVFVVLMALSLALGAVSAAEDAGSADAAVANVAPATDGNAAGGDVPVTAEAVSEEPTADLAVDVEPLFEDEYSIVWGIKVTNYGPFVAINTDVFVDGSDNLFLWDYLATDGVFDPELLIWDVGDVLVGDSAYLFVETLKLDEGPYYVDAFVLSDTLDPDYSNNYDIAWVGLDASAAEETTLPATGNPLAVALLALLAIGIGGIKRRF